MKNRRVYRIPIDVPVGPGGSLTATVNGRRQITLETAVAQGGSGSEVVIDPGSEAGVRLIAQNGLENFIDEGIPEIIERSQRANEDTAFAGLTADQGAELATETASGSLAVRDSVEANRILRHDMQTSTRIDPLGDLDVYGFTLLEGRSIILQATGGIFPCLEVRAAGSLQLVAADCGVNQVRLNVDLEPGAYTVLVNGGGTGNYNLQYNRIAF